MIINASAHQIPLADKSIHSICTSPPYFGLRRYPGAQDIAWPAGAYAPCTGAPPCIEVPEMLCALGNEPTIEAYIWHSLLILRECRRVLRDDGVLWWNLGDTYSDEGKWGGRSGNKNDLPDWQYLRERSSRNRKRTGIGQGNLIGIPHRLMLAAQADDWIVRNDLVWGKAAPMPESLTGWRWVRHQVKIGSKRINSGKKGQQERPHGAQNGAVFDSRAQWTDCPGCNDCAENGGYVLRRGSWRHTRAHEFVFQMVKGMGYYCNGEAVRESAEQRRLVSWDDRKSAGEPLRNGDPAQTGYQCHTASMASQPGRNPRSVLQPSPSSYKGAHFAVFPPELIRPLIMASVPRRCCSVCGMAWAPLISQTKTLRGDAFGKKDQDRFSHGQGSRPYEVTKNPVESFSPCCDCPTESHRPGVVLDPFCGSGTTGEVARECLVDFIGLDISYEYLNDQAAWRSERTVSIERINELPLFAGVK